MLPVGTNLRLKSVPKAVIGLIAANSILYWFDFADADFILNLFSHGDFFHLFFNMLFLWSFGSYLEDKIGWRRFLWFYFISYLGAELMWRTLDGRPSIGASGAISGVMGLYLYRCRYAKIKTIIDPFGVFFFNVTVNAKWMLLLWFARDVYDAMNAGPYDIVAYWAHIGGYLTGMLIGKIYGFDAEATKEHLYEQGTDLLNKGVGLEEAERHLLYVCEKDPENPDARLQLARLYSMQSDFVEKGREYYIDAARLFYLKDRDKSKAGSAFLEYIMKYGRAEAPDLHLRYSNTLASTGDYGGAAKILVPLLDTDGLKGAVGERAMFNLIKYSTISGMELRDYALSRFKTLFPESVLVREAEGIVSKGRPKAMPAVKRSHEVREGWGLREKFDEITSEPVFWLSWILAINIFIKIFNRVEWDAWTFLLLLGISLAVPFIVTYGITEFSSTFGSIFYGGRVRSEREGRREFNLGYCFDKAVSCERGEQYEDAAEYYRAVIDEDGKHIEAWFRLARIYHRKLNQPDQAARAYRGLLQAAPQGHPYRMEAGEGMRALCKI